MRGLVSTFRANTVFRSTNSLASSPSTSTVASSTHINHLAYHTKNVSLPLKDEACCENYNAIHVDVFG